MTTRHPLTIACSVALALALASVGCSKPRQDPAPGDTAEAPQNAKAAFGELSMTDFESRVADAQAGKLKLAIYDNNHKEQYVDGHIPGAKWVDFKNVTAADLPADKDTTLVFYCSNEL